MDGVSESESKRILHTSRIDCIREEAKLIVTKLSDCDEINIATELLRLFAVDLLKSYPRAKDIFLEKFEKE